MLVLARRPGERVLLELEDGRCIWLTLLRWHNGQGKIGIEAPQSVKITREELLPTDGERRA